MAGKESNGKQEAKGKVRIAVVQYEVRPISSFDDFAKQVSTFAQTAAPYKADFILFPELFITQLFSYMHQKNGTYVEQVCALEQQFVELFSRLARETRMYIIAGTTLVKEHSKLYNVSYIFHRDGTHTKQYKIHITPWERELWNVQPGDEVQVIETDRGKVAVLICYDIEFPELSRIAAGKGANIIFCPSNTDQRAAYLRVRLCAQARCIENQVYVALSGCSGNMPLLEGGGDIHYSQSAIFTPSDLGFPPEAVAAQSDPNVETMIIQDIDLDLLEAHRTKGSVRTWSDRRLDLYEIHYGAAGGKQKV